MRHYSDYFHVKEDYCPNMTREEINQTPERWLDFCPHPEFEEICNTILSVLSSGASICPNPLNPTSAACSST